MKKGYLPKQNIFIVGSPRSGKTLLQQMLGYHDDIAWFSQYYTRFRGNSLLTYLNNIYKIPKLGTVLASREQKKFLPKPVEMPKDYNSKLEANGSLDESDVLKGDEIKLKAVFEKQARIQKKEIFLTDEGRPARMLYFSKIFPNSKYIHVIRDGRNVVATFLKDRSAWFDEKKDLNSFYKNVPQEFARILQEYEGTKYYKLVLAALRWKMAILELEKQSRKLQEGSYMYIRYEDLIGEKQKVIGDCLEFLGLNWTKNLKAVVSSKTLYNENIWKEYFNPREKEILQELLGDLLKKYGYEKS